MPNLGGDPTAVRLYNYIVCPRILGTSCAVSVCCHCHESAQFHLLHLLGAEGIMSLKFALKTQVFVLRVRLALNLLRLRFIRRTP